MTPAPEIMYLIEINNCSQITTTTTTHTASALKCELTRSSAEQSMYVLSWRLIAAPCILVFLRNVPSLMTESAFKPSPHTETS